jgi:hypothetical protein
MQESGKRKKRNSMVALHASRTIDILGDYDALHEDYVIHCGKFESLPNPNTLLALLMDASRFVKRLSNLSKFIGELWTEQADPRDLWLFPIISRVFELWYLKIGTRRSLPSILLNTYRRDPCIPGDASFLDQDRLYWRVSDTNTWDDLLVVWRTIAGKDARTMFIHEHGWKKGRSYLSRYECMKGSSTAGNVLECCMSLIASPFIRDLLLGQR